MMKADKVLFPSITWWLLLLVPFVFFGFYPSYFSKLLSPMDSIFHVHAFFMGLWVTLAIVQPFLIHKKKIRMHRRLGKLSYLVMPLVLVTGYMVISQAYNARVEQAIASAATSGTKAENLISNLQETIIIGIVYLFWLACFYGLAVINRRRMIAHATFMFAAILTLLGPTLDRLIFHIYDYFEIQFNLFAETAVFVFIDLLLLGLLWYQWRKSYKLKPVLTALIIYIVGQIAYFFLPPTEAWKSFVSFIL